jgi:hypothetical protein
LVAALRDDTTGRRVHQEVFLCFRVLLLRFSATQLRSFWPVVLAELIRVFALESPDANLVLAAVKFVDLAAVLRNDSFVFCDWIFLGDEIARAPSKASDRAAIARDSAAIDDSSDAVDDETRDGRLQDRSASTVSDVVVVFHDYRDGSSKREPKQQRGGDTELTVASASTSSESATSAAPASAQASTSARVVTVTTSASTPTTLRATVHTATSPQASASHASSGHTGTTSATMTHTTMTSSTSTTTSSDNEASSSAASRSSPSVSTTSTASTTARTSSTTTTDSDTSSVDASTRPAPLLHEQSYRAAAREQRFTPLIVALSERAHVDRAGVYVRARCDHACRVVC